MMNKSMMDLIERLEFHARLHIHNSQFDEEQMNFANDLLRAIDIIKAHNTLVAASETTSWGHHE